MGWKGRWDVVRTNRTASELWQRSGDLEKTWRALAVWSLIVWSWTLETPVAFLFEVSVECGWRAHHEQFLNLSETKVINLSSRRDGNSNTLLCPRVKHAFHRYSHLMICHHQLFPQLRLIPWLKIRLWRLWGRMKSERKVYRLQTGTEEFRCWQ